MNRTYQVLSVTAIALAVLVAACRKTPGPEKNDPYYPGVTSSPPATYPPTPTIPLATLFSDLKPTPQIITVPAGIAQTVYAAKGTQLNFYPNSFKDAYGNIITSGNVQVEITEMYKPGDMIANMASTTTTTGDLLESGGQVNINATMGGQPVYANVYGLGFKQATPDSTKQMALYIGNNTSNTNGITRWKIGDTAKNGRRANGTQWVNIGAGSHSDLYIFDSCTDFTWINCDRAHNGSGSKTCVDIVVTDSTYNTKNSEVFIVFPTIKSVAYPEAYLASANTFRAGNSNHYLVPIGMEINVVVMTKKNNGYYYYEQKGITVVDSTKVHANMKPLSLDSVKIKLSNL